MKSLLCLISFLLLSGSTFANDKTYEWILSKYEAAVSSSTGLIDGETHLAVIAGDGISGNDQYLGVFNKSQGKFVGAALARLPRPDDSEYKVEIKNDSIFLTRTLAHHGVSRDRYQFKKNIGGPLKLVGVESQGETWCTYYDAAPDGCNNSVRSGNSYNLLSSTTICWMEIESDNISSRPRKDYQPRGVQHETQFPRITLPPLDGFNVAEFTPPKSCHFDYKKKLHVGDPSQETHPK